MGEGEGGVDTKEFNVAMVERMKTDTQFRNRLFSRLEQEVPEFTQSFLVERDYIMAEVIRRETDAKHVVAVVGLAHVPGMAENLRAADFQ
jgi:pheromone shutdown protein TraB